MKIDFWPAIEWICDECGRNNYSSMIAPEISSEEEQEIKNELDIEPWEDGDLLLAPESVSCKFCGETFELNDEPRM